jgi:hypothetical protein
MMSSFYGLVKYMGIVGLKTSYPTYLTITKTRKGRPRPDPGCSATDDDENMWVVTLIRAESK